MNVQERALPPTASKPMWGKSIALSGAQSTLGELAWQPRLTFLLTESPGSFRLFPCLFRIPKLQVKLGESEANPWIFGGDFFGTLQLDESFFGPAHVC